MTANIFLYRKASIVDIPLLTDLRLEFLFEVNKNTQFKDADILQKNILSYFNHHIPTESFVGWICMYDNIVVGTSGISFYNVPPSYNNHNGIVGYIMNMYTKKEFRNKGIASTLFDKMLAEGRNKNVGKFTLNATSSGKSLYQKYGFVLTGNEMILSL